VLFLPILIAIFKPSVNPILSSLQDVSVLVIVMAFFMIWVGCWLPLAAMLAIAFKWQPQLHPDQKLPFVISLYLLAPLILWGASWITNTPISNFGFVLNVSVLVSLWLGFGLGLLSLAIVFLCEIWLGWCSFQKSNIKLIASSFLLILLVALFIGGIEELVFRGFLLTELQLDYPVWAAAVISSLIFALLHLVWEQRETVPQLPGLLLMGMVLVLARFVDNGNLGLAWGLHAGWVWAIACMDTAQLINYTAKVPDWVTGKNNKPLAGVAGIVCLLLTGVVIWVVLGS
jgi:membrane protease YdiL (CAAX protease family)